MIEKKIMIKKITTVSWTWFVRIPSFQTNRCIGLNAAISLRYRNNHYVQGIIIRDLFFRSDIRDPYTELQSIITLCIICCCEFWKCVMYYSLTLRHKYAIERHETPQNKVYITNFASTKPFCMLIRTKKDWLKANEMYTRHPDLRFLFVQKLLLYNTIL